jgi:type I restriction enzyme S subunit
MQVQVGVSREGLSMARLKEFVIALPPLAEQRRIVAKVEELLALCDELEARQLATRTTATHLLDAALNQLLKNHGHE